MPHIIAPSGWLRMTSQMRTLRRCGRDFTPATKWNIWLEQQMTSSREITSGLARPGVNLPRAIQAIGPEKYFWSPLNYIQPQLLTEYPTWLTRKSAGPSINRNCKKYRPRNITILKKYWTQGPDVVKRNIWSNGPVSRPVLIRGKGTW